MLKVIFLYIFIWWFKKSDNKKELIVRSALAAAIGAFWMIFGIVMFTETSSILEKDSWGFIIAVLIYIVLVILFFIRSILDISKILKLKNDKAEGQQKVAEEQRKAEEEQQKSKGNWLERTDGEERRGALERYENLKKENEAREKRETEQTQKIKLEHDSIKHQQDIIKYEQDIETSKKLLKQCGMQFFIDYYPQLKRLPIRDIILSDNYSSEREVRLPPAKKIVESGLTECALRYIIEKFGDVFSSEVIERAKAILHEIENEKTEVNQNENN